MYIEYWPRQNCKARYGGTRRDLKGHELGDPEYQPSPRHQHSVKSLSSACTFEKRTTAKHCQAESLRTYPFRFYPGCRGATTVGIFHSAQKYLFVFSSIKP